MDISGLILDCVTKRPYFEFEKGPCYTSVCVGALLAMLMFLFRVFLAVRLVFLLTL